MMLGLAGDFGTAAAGLAAVDELVDGEGGRGQRQADARQQPGVLAAILQGVLLLGTEGPPAVGAVLDYFTARERLQSAPPHRTRVGARSGDRAPTRGPATRPDRRSHLLWRGLRTRPPCCGVVSGPRRLLWRGLRTTPLGPTAGLLCLEEWRPTVGSRGTVRRPCPNGETVPQRDAC